MSAMIQIRNVPDALHRKLKARAALEGRSLSEYLLETITEAAARPTMRERLAQVASREPINLKDETLKILREDRESR